METLDELLDYGEQHARRVLIGTKDQIIPIFHILKSDGEAFVLAAPWPNDEAKNALADMLREVMRESGVKAYMFMTEAWVGRPPMGWEPGDRLPVMPSQQPERIEVVLLSACNPDKERMRILEIKRGPGGECASLQRHDALVPGNFGTFKNMLRRDA